MGATQPLPTKAFDFSNVIVTFGADTLNGGLESIKVARAEDSWSTHVSADGTVTRVRNNNRMGRISLVYGQNSPALDTLSAINQLDEASGTGGARTITVKDGNGRSIATAPQAWIVKPPDAEYQKEATTREWSFDCDQLTHTLGGLT